MLRILRPFIQVGVAASLMMLAGCDSFPLAIQNQTGATVIVEYATRAGKCDLNRSENLTLAPGERFAIRCAPSDLLGVSFMEQDGHKCILSNADIVRELREEKGFKGSFLLPLRGC